MQLNDREHANQTVLDAFRVVERIYRHTYQTLIALKDEIKSALDLKFESPQIPQSQSSTDPKSWIHQYRGLHLAREKFSLEDYRKSTPILFLQASLYGEPPRKPILRYGMIERIFDFIEYKNPRFDDYFKKILLELHSAPRSGDIETGNCKARLDYKEKPLLDILETQDVVALAKETVAVFGPSLHQRA